MTRDEAIDTLVRQLQDRSKAVRDVRAVYRRGKSEVVIERQNIVETIGLHRDFGEHHIPGLVEKYTPEWEVSAAPVAGAVLTARETISKLTATSATGDPLDLPLVPLVEEAIARYGQGSEPPMTPAGWMSWGEEERVQWNAYAAARWS